MIQITDIWKSEKVDLRPVKQLITQYYFSHAIVTACNESDHARFIEELLSREEPVSLYLLEKIANQINSDATLCLISQFRGTIDVPHQSQSTRNSMRVQSDFSVQLFIEKLLKFGWKCKITIAIISALILSMSFAKLLAYSRLITAAVVAAGIVADTCVAALE